MKRALALLAPAVLALGLAACGDDDDDDSPDVTTATEETTTEVTTGATEGEDGESGVSIPENADNVLAEMFPSLSAEQVDCLVEQAADVTDVVDPDQAEAIAEACDIDPADLADINTAAISVPDLGDITLPDNFDEMMAQAFPGLDEEQIDCLLEELGPELDLSQAAQLAETCDIDPADLTPG